MTNPSLTLLVRVGTLTCALPVDHVVETLRPLPVEPVAHAPEFVRGLSIIRDVPVPVVDLRILLAASSSGDPQRLVTVRTGDCRLALAVDAIPGLREIDPATLSELPRLFGEGRGDWVETIGTLDADLLMVLRAGRILPPELLDALVNREATT